MNRFFIFIIGVSLLAGGATDIVQKFCLDTQREDIVTLLEWVDVHRAEIATIQSDLDAMRSYNGIQDGRYERLFDTVGDILYPSRWAAEPPASGDPRPIGKEVPR